MIKLWHSRKCIHLAAAATLLASLTLQLAQAQEGVESPAAAPMAIGDLKGTWLATLSGVTGCGVTTLVTTFTLDENGNGTQINAVEHTAGCGSLNQAGQIAQVQKLKTNGHGFIALGCGEGCGFGFQIQVNRDHNSFNMGAQPVPGNYLAGMAIRR